MIRAEVAGIEREPVCPIEIVEIKIAAQAVGITEDNRDRTGSLIIAIVDARSAHREIREAVTVYVTNGGDRLPGILARPDRRRCDAEASVVTREIVVLRQNEPRSCISEQHECLARPAVAIG